MSILNFKTKKQNGQKLSMLTCYDFWSAQLLNDTNVDALLVGDSLAMVMHGHNSTIPADCELMALHIQSVKKGAPKKLVVGDMPFLSNRKDLKTNMDNVETIMRAGAEAIKIEGAVGNLELIQHCVNSGVPVMGHLGLTPQFVHQLGGFKVQGKEKDKAELIYNQALMMQESGCFSLVLECVPTQLAERITKDLSIPTIGIGAGPHTDGQILVLQDMLGMNTEFKPKFVRQFIQGHEVIKNACNEYVEAVESGDFPNINESYEI